MAGVGDADFDGFGFRVDARGNGDFAIAGIFQGFGGIVDQVDEHAAQKDAIGPDRRKVFGEGGFYDDAIETAGENLQGFVDKSGGVSRLKLGAGKAHELRELIDQIGERGDFAFDQARAFLNQASELGIGWRRRGQRICTRLGATFEKAGESLGGELDGRERILDFVRDAAGDFLPGGELLRAQ